MRKNKWVLDIVDGIICSSFHCSRLFPESSSISRMPNEGTIGFSTIVLLLASFQMGWRKGSMVALMTIPIQGFFHLTIL